MPRRARAAAVNRRDHQNAYKRGRKVMGKLPVCRYIDSPMKYQSNLPYDPQRIHAAAVYCSDGRVGEHFDDFLQNSLKLPRYDRVALPGGPACLAGHTEAHVAEQGVVDELNFLVEAHGLERIVLIAHAGCAFYSSRLHLPQEYLEPQQKIDLVKAAGFIRRITGIQHIDAYFARPTHAQVIFETVAI